jgi:photosystem II stability/assembly factor-like uncharacterized protein
LINYISGVASDIINIEKKNSSALFEDPEENEIIFRSCINVFYSLICFTFAAMKKTYLLLLFIAIQLDLSAQLKWLNPTPSGWINTKIHFTSLSKGYLMNSNGDFFITADTGNTWQTLGNFPGARTFKIQQSTGLMPAFDSSIYLSTDNGASWYKSISSPGGGLAADWCDIVGGDTLFVQRYINNYVTSLYKSVNRGASWQLINNDLNQFYFNSIDFITSKIGYALKPGGIFKTADGGVTWQNLYGVTTSANVICMKFYDALNGLAYRESTGMLRTTDGGASWSLSTQVSADDINDIFYADSLTVYAAGEDGAAYKSVDGGNNWTWIGPNGRIYAYNLYSQYFFNANDGIVTGHRGRLLRTRNGGASWEWHSPTYIDVTAISFGNPSTGYTTTWNNLYKTTDSGSTWNALPLTTPPAFTNSRFDHCRFTSADTGIVTTNFPPRIFSTIDGGQSWTTTSFTQPQYDYISSMSFISRDTGFASLRGSLNGLHKTVDGGITWQEIGNYQNFTVVHFITSDYGYAVFYDKIYRTFNGGLSWFQLTQPTGQPYTSILFITPAKGFAIGNSTLLKMTIDSGVNWTNINVTVPVGQPDFSAINFYNQRIGYITDDEGRYYKTIDSGYHWKQNGTTAFYECRSILFRPDTTVLFAGMYGTIVSRSIADYAIDSVRVIPSVCGAEFRAKIMSFLSPVDSIWFQYGKNSYTNLITATPSKVSDTSLVVVAMVSDLQPDSVYHMRVKILFKGKNYYSDDFVFMPKKLSAPVITATANILTSSAPAGNQWYLNGTAIAGATGQQFAAMVTGSYTVVVSVNGCTSPPSAAINLTVTAVPTVSAWNNEVTIFPNPVLTGEVTIKVPSGRRLILQITDINGSLIKTRSLRNGVNTLSLSALQSGVYLFLIKDSKTLEAVQRKILKL